MGGKKTKNLSSLCCLQAHTLMMLLILPLRSGVCFSTTDISLTKWLALANQTSAQTVQAQAGKVLGSWSWLSCCLEPWAHGNRPELACQKLRGHMEGALLLQWIPCWPPGSLVKPFQSHPAKPPVSPAKTVKTVHTRKRAQPMTRIMNFCKKKKKVVIVFVHWVLVWFVITKMLMNTGGLEMMYEKQITQHLLNKLVSE